VKKGELRVTLRIAHTVLDGPGAATSVVLEIKRGTPRTRR